LTVRRTLGAGSERAPHIVILGAGVAGLYAGRVLARSGARVTIIEREDVVGGLASGVKLGGNFHDLGVHHLHAFDEEIFSDIRSLMGDRLVAVPKRALIKYGRGYRRYPLEFADMLRGIPPWTLARTLTGLCRQMAVNRVRPKAAENAEDALIELYGRPLYEHFFRDFTTEYWGIPPAMLSATFVRRKMPRLSAVDVLKRLFERTGVGSDSGSGVESALANETLWYSPTGSRELPLALASRIASDGGLILTGTSVRAVETSGGRVTAVRATDANRAAKGTDLRLDCDACLSTIPLPYLVGALTPPPPHEVRAAAACLDYKATVVYGVLVRRARVLDGLYVYFRDRVFHRVAEPRQSGLEVRPPGHTLLLAEMTCDVGDARWDGASEVRAQVVRDLCAEGLIEAEDVVGIEIRRTSHGYPVFALGFEESLATVNAHLELIPNLRSTGRQGGFCYPNMHTAMRMGASTADELLAEALRAEPRGVAADFLEPGEPALEADGALPMTSLPVQTRANTSPI
jgi:protoporphyrinogen oxidase